MQRQSLGSPVSKLHSHGGDDTIVAEDPRRRVAEDDDDGGGERKATKPRRLSFSPSSSPPSPSASRPEKFIHLIPVLTLLCFLILYLSSHAPSQSDLAHFAQFKRSSKQLDSSDEIGDASEFVELRKGDILAIRSLRNLQVLEKQTPKSRPHRKIADF
ncbi:hypothetical protein SLE2022_224800 [Rubroshorea leprosula]